MKRIINMLLVSLAVCGFASVATPFAAPALAACSNGDPKCYACEGIGLAGSNTGTCGDQGAQFNNILKTVLEILSVVIGIAAVVMIMVAGLRFITAGGDASKIAGAKNSIIYAIIGLVIVVAAQGVVFFVLNNISK